MVSIGFGDERWQFSSRSVLRQVMKPFPPHALWVGAAASEEGWQAWRPSGVLIECDEDVISPMNRYYSNIIIITVTIIFKKLYQILKSFLLRLKMFPLAFDSGTGDGAVGRARSSSSCRSLGRNGSGTRSGSTSCTASTC